MSIDNFFIPVFDDDFDDDLTDDFADDLTDDLTDDLADDLTDGIFFVKILTYSDIFVESYLSIVGF